MPYKSALLHIRHFAILENHFHVFVVVSRLGWERDFLIRLAQCRFHLRRSHTHLHACRFLLRRCLLAAAALLIPLCPLLLIATLLLAAALVLLPAVADR